MPFVVDDWYLSIEIEERGFYGFSYVGECYFMTIFSAGFEGVNVPFESFRSRRSLRKTTPPPNVATVLSTPEGFPWRHFSPR